jgi:hypothetical protein
MQKYLWRSLGLGTALLFCYLVGAKQTVAHNHETIISDLSQELPQSQPEIDPLSLGVNDLGDGDINTIDQVTSVSQLRDVSPRDWAFDALRNLVEQYGCIQGYPNSTFRGDRSMTRYEFAAGLNACLQGIEALINNGSTPSEDDLATLARLTREFQIELTAIGEKVDDLEGRVTLLEDNQFSTTTKLSGLAFFNVTGAFAGGNVKVETSNLNPPLELRPAARLPTGEPVVSQVTRDPSVTLSNLIWLTLNTSFTGKDNLITQIAAGNGITPANQFASAGLFNTFGAPFTDQTAGPEIFGSRNDVILRELAYSFPVTDNFQLVVGPRINWYRYFDGNAFTFFLNGAGSFNSGGSTLSNTLDRGSGAIALWDLSDQFKLNFGYLGENTEFLPGGLFNTSSNPRDGVFGGTNTSTVELTYSPSSDFNARLFYNYSHLNAVFGTIGNAMGEPIYGIADAGPGKGLDINPNDGGLKDSWSHTFGVNFDWLISSGLGIFGRYTYGSTNLEPIDQKINAQSIQAGLAFPDLGKEGASATLSFLIPFEVLDGRKYLASGGGDGGTQYEIEANYYYPINNNIAVVPSFYTIINANNFNTNPAIYVFNLRTQFSF